MLAGILQYKVFFDALCRLRPHLDLSPFGECGNTRRQVGRWPGGGEGPAPTASSRELGGANKRFPAVDANMNGYRGVDAYKLLVEVGQPMFDLHRGIGGMQRMPCGTFLALEDHHEPIPGRFIDVTVI